MHKPTIRTTMRPRLSISLFFLLLTAVTAPAELIDFVVDKRAVYYQDSSFVSVPTNAAFLDYSFEITGDTTLIDSGTSFSANLQPVPFQFQDEDQWRGYVACPSVTQLQNTYPNLDFYDFTTQILGDAPRVSQGEYFSGAAFPLFVPQVSNFLSTTSITPGAAFTINLSNNANGAMSSEFDNYILLSLYDPVSLETVFEEPYAYTDTTLEIPSDVLSLNQDFLARIQFVSPDTLHPASGTSEYPVQTRYLRENWLRLRTAGNAPTLTPVINREWVWKQVNAGNLTAQSDQDSLTVTIPRPAANNASGATFIQIDLRRQHPLEATDPGDNDAFSLTFSGSELEAFDSSLVGVGWEFDSGKTNFEFTPWDLAEPTQGPEILNFEACQQFPSTSDFTIIVERPDNLTGDILAELAIRTIDDQLIYQESVNVGQSGDIYVAIPADTLAPDTTYEATLHLRPEEDPGAALELFATHTVTFPVEARQATWPGVKSVAQYRGAYFDNETGEPSFPMKASFSLIITELEEGTLSSASIQEQKLQPISTLDNTVYHLARSTDFRGQFGMSYLGETESDVLQAFPYATYDVSTELNSVVSTRPIELTEVSAAAPTIQVDTSYFGDNLDPSLPIPIRWTGIDVSDSNVTLEFMVLDESPIAPDGADAFPIEAIAADGFSGVIPPNTLAPNTDYSFLIVFRRNLEADTDAFEETEIILGDEYFTNVELTTGTAQYASWLGDYLDNAQLNDPTYAAPDANPDGDQFDNVQEFALNLDPLQSSPGPRIQDGGTFYLFEFDWRRDAPLINYELRYTSTLVPPFDVYEDDPNTILGSPYDQLRFFFPYVTPLFVQLVVTYGAP